MPRLVTERSPFSGAVTKTVVVGIISLAVKGKAGGSEEQPGEEGAGFVTCREPA